MLASATEVEVELDVPHDVSTFFGVTWAQDPREDKIFIKAFPKGSDGRRGILESTGLVELNDCLTAINGVPLPKPSGLREVMARIRAAESPLSLRFARYPPPPLLRNSSSSSLSTFGPAGTAAAGFHGAVPSSPGAGSLSSGSGGGGSGGGGGGGGLGSPEAVVGGKARSAGAGRVDGERRELAADPDLDGVLNSALVLGLGERVADVQKRNARLVQEVDRMGRAASDKRQGVERVASAAASLTAAGGDLLPQALRLLSTARQDAVALCEAMARLDELLAARERAQLARRRSFEEENSGRGWESTPDAGGGGGGRGGAGDGIAIGSEYDRR